MLWLFITIISYILLAAVFLVDKYLLASSVRNPRILAFWVGTLSVLGILFLPFGLLALPPITIISASLIAGILRLWATYFYFKTLKRFEASRVITAVNVTQSIFSFWLVILISGGSHALDIWQLSAFALMIVGSLIITAEKEFFNINIWRFSLLASFLFSLSFVVSKIAYDGFAAMPPVSMIPQFDPAFVSGFIWIGLGSFIGSLPFLFASDVRKELHRPSTKANLGKASKIFAASQIVGLAAFALQSFAIKLAPLEYVAIINALAGIQYLFLFLFSIILSIYFPRLIKEKISPRIITQKMIALILIFIGLAILCALAQK